MRKVLRKVKSQWAVLGVMGATVVALGTANVQQVAATEVDAAFVGILSTTVVDYDATITRGSDGINTKPWGTEGFETIGTSADYLNAAVSVNQEQVADNGVTWALISLNGQELGWIAKDALTVQIPVEIVTETYAQIVSEAAVDYAATISRSGDGINTQPWNVKGWQTVGTSATYVDQTVEVSKEQVTDYGVTWAWVSLDGQELGWIAKDALTVQNYAQIVSETIVDYPATISRGTDAVNTAPWGAKGYKNIGSSADYVGKSVTVSKEQVTDYGVTWAQISLNGEVLGWIAKDALTVQNYAQIVSETVVDYPATISRGTDAVNTAPWGAKGYHNISSSADYVGKSVTVSKEQVTDYGVTWAFVSLDGKELGWIAKDALTVQNYAQIVSETVVDYSATISRGTDAVNTAPWGAKGYKNIGSSADYAGRSVDVSKEQITDYGVTWALISLDGKELGWIAKDALTVQNYAQIVSETVVDYSATISRGTDAVNTAPWGAKGYQTIASSADYVGQSVKITKEQVTDYGVTWVQISLNGEVLGWIAKDAITVSQAIVLNGSSLQMAAIVLPEGTTATSAIWSVETGTGTANIDGNGVLTATGAGTVTIKATSKDGSVVLGTKEVIVAVPVAVTDYVGTEKDIVIPEMIRGNQIDEAGNYDGFTINESIGSDKIGIITSIGFEAFRDNQLTSVVIPDSVTSIGMFAFYLNQLTSVVLPESMTRIGDYAFSNNQLTSIVIPESVTSIGQSVFSGNQLTSVVIPDSVTSIGQGAFGGNQLTSVVIPDSVTSIGGSSFSNNQLTSIIIPEGVTKIAPFAFSNNQLASVVIPDSVTRIDFKAFADNRLTSVDIPEGLTYIGYGAFDNNQLTSIVIPEGVQWIENDTFSNNQLTSIVLPENTTVIKPNAFSNNKLTSVVIPDGVTIIGGDAFSNNELTSVIIPEGVELIQNNAFSNNQLTSIIIPESVTLIFDGALSQNQLTTITIGSGVQIGDNLLGMNNDFRVAYTTGGAGTYIGTQDGEWIKTVE